MSTHDKSNAPIEIDHIILVCKGCRGERTIYPDVPLRGAEQLIAWMKTKPTRCACGATHCNVKAHLKDVPT